MEELQQEHQATVKELEKEKKSILDELESINHFKTVQTQLFADLEDLKSQLEKEKKDRMK